MDEQEAGTEGSQEEHKDDSTQSENPEERSEAVSNGEERDQLEGQAGDALAWLEGPAFDSPIEEMPTLQWPDVEAEASAAGPARSVDDVEGTGDDTPPPRDELEDAMQWLEELAKEQGTPLEEMPTLISGGESEQDLAARAAAARGLEQLGDTTPPPQLDSDPMAWLEQLAIDQDSPLEDLPSVADRLLASEIASQTALDGEQMLEPLASQPVELEAALKYLEDQAAAEGVVLDEVSIDDVETDDTLDEDLDAIDKMVTVAAVTTAVTKVANADADEFDADENDSEALEDLPAQIPEDSDEELAWLSELAEEESPVEQSELVDEEDVPDQEDQTEDNEKDGSLLKKGAAAVAATKLVKSRTDDGQETEPETEQAEEAQTLTPESLEGMPDDPDEAMAWMGTLAEEESNVDQASEMEQEADSDQDGETDKDKDGSLLKKGTAAVAAAKLAQSLVDDGQEPGPESEPAAEDKMLDAEILEGMPDDPDEAMAWMAGLAVVDTMMPTEQAEAAEADEMELPMAELAEEADLELSEELVQARATLQSGDVGEAVQQYRQLLDSGQGGQQLIDELETAVASQPKEPELIQLLGDAYMQDGQLQKALKTYRAEFDQN